MRHYTLRKRIFAVGLPIALALTAGSLGTALAVSPSDESSASVSLANGSVVVATDLVNKKNEAEAAQAEAARIEAEAASVPRSMNSKSWRSSSRGGGSSLDSIANCESGGDPTAVSSSGKHRGKYQFDQGTWEGVGGTGDPAAASEAEQDQRAAQLYAQRGSSPWRNCAR